MLYTEFDAFVPKDRTEAVRPLFPKHLQAEIEELNEWVYNTINNGVYKTGFATTQEAYEEHLNPLFASLDRLEKHLEEPGHSPYLFGEHITEADIRLYPSIARFDVAYFTLFKCNLRMIRYEYPKLQAWYQRLYWDTGEETNGGAFGSTTKFDHVSLCSSHSVLLLECRSNDLHRSKEVMPRPWKRRSFLLVLFLILTRYDSMTCVTW